jgi:hypothetical protein
MRACLSKAVKVAPPDETLSAATRRMREVAPAVTETTDRLEQLIARRVTLEAVRGDRSQANSLRDMQAHIERSAKDARTPVTEWEQLPAAALRALCNEVEAVLRIWKWTGEGSDLSAL